MINPATIHKALSASTPIQVEYFPELPSTNSYLNRRCQQGAAPWSVVVAERQTAGRGRYQRAWESPPGVGLWFSILLRPALAADHLNLVNMLAAVTLSHLLETECRRQSGTDTRIVVKWPNDLMIGARKLCGILLESQFSKNKLEALIVGIGLNVNHDPGDFPPELRERAVSLKMLCGQPLDRQNLLIAILDAFYQNYQHYIPERLPDIRQMYLKKVASLGEEIVINLGHSQLTGKFEDITGEGCLVLNVAGERRIISTGEIFAENKG